MPVGSGCPDKPKIKASGSAKAAKSELSVLLVPPVLIGDHVKIGARAVIGPHVVLGDKCSIGPNVRLSETILWDGCRVNEGAYLNNCIFGYGLELGPRHILHEAVMNRLGVMQA